MCGNLGFEEQGKVDLGALSNGGEIASEVLSNGGGEEMVDLLNNFLSRSIDNIENNVEISVLFISNVSSELVKSFDILIISFIFLGK